MHSEGQGQPIRAGQAAFFLCSPAWPSVHAAELITAQALEPDSLGSNPASAMYQLCDVGDEVKQVFFYSTRTIILR